MKNRITLFLGVLSFFSIQLQLSAADPVEVFNVWPDSPPGDNRNIGEEHILEGRPRPFYQITDVSTPTVSVYLPPEGEQTGAAILLAPGGGLQRLAIEHEGIEVSNFLASKGITVFLLKYRVPASAQMGLQDAQRAMGIIRSRAEEWGIDTNTFGMMGFSAGAEITARLMTSYEERGYESIDDADTFPIKPDFAVLIYSGGLAGRGGELRPDIANGINRDTPPTFITHAFDDDSRNSLAMAMALKQARVPTEVHLYEQGGHGFGVRPSGHPVSAWKDNLIDWMSSHGYLDPKAVREYEQEFVESLNSGGSIKRLTAVYPEATINDGYASQERVVRHALENGEHIAGYKGGVITEAAQQSMGVDSPLTGVLFASGGMNAGGNTVLNLAENPGMVVETEIAYFVAVDIGYKILNADQARDAVSEIAPVIELPVDYSGRAGESLNAIDLLAVNMGSAKYMVGQRKQPSSITDVNALPISLIHNGEILHEVSAGSAKGGQWENLMNVINNIVDQGQTIRSGSVIICGALGSPRPAEKGTYEADYGDLGKIQFEVE